MAKALHCKDIGFDCGFVARAETEDEILRQAAAHAERDHGLTELDPATVERVRSAIRPE